MDCLTANYLFWVKHYKRKLDVLILITRKTKPLIAIDNLLKITFLDKKYVNTRTNLTEFGMIVISFKEEFKQINFNDNIVYTATLFCKGVWANRTLTCQRT